MIITVGVPCSGKSTYAKELCEKDDSFIEINRDWIRHNVVCPGSDWSNYKFTKKREQDVTQIQEEMIMDAFAKGKSVIMSDTNLNEKTRNKLIKVADDLGYEVEIKEFPISLEEAWKRDANRSNGVGHSVVYQMYQKWLEYKGRKTYAPDESKPKAVILDLDGTLAQMVNRSPYEWHRVGEDSARQLIIDMAKGFDAQGYTILVVSGRDSVCFDETSEWLKDNEVPYFYLYMREEGDIRKDTIVKEEIFWDLIADNWNVVGVVDDRPAINRLWMELKIPNVINVGNPYIEF